MMHPSLLLLLPLLAQIGDGPDPLQTLPADTALGFEAGFEGATRASGRLSVHTIGR